MTVTLQRTLKDAGATAAIQLTAAAINADGTGVPATAVASTWTDASLGTTYYGAGNSATGGTSYTTNVGFRRAFSAAQDLTDRQFIQWRLPLQWNPNGQKKWASGGGFVIVFYDGTGNWAGYKLTGGDAVWSNTSEGSGVFMDFNRGGFNGPSGLNDYRVAYFHLDRTRTADYSSGTINWASVSGYELHARPDGTGTRVVCLVGQIYTVDNPAVTGAAGLTTAMVNLRDQISTTQGHGGISCYCFDGVSSYPMFGGAPSSTFYSAIGFQVGNGGTNTTTGTLASGTVAFLNPPEDTHDTASPRYYGLQGYFLPGTTSRLADVYQGASDNVTFNDQNWASSRGWGVRVRGTPGVAAFNRDTFTRPSQFECAHGAFTDCLWDAPTAAVQVTTATVIARGVIRNGTHGLKVIGAAAIYSNLDLSLGGASTYDLQVGSGGAGTYTLPDLSATTTLKIRNDSAVNAVIVEIPAGIAYTTSTAGGTIAVQTPSALLDADITTIVSGSTLRIFNETTGLEVYAVVGTGTSYASTTTSGVDYNVGDVVRVDLAKPGYQDFSGRAIVSTAGWSVIAEQEVNTVYNVNGIDGTTCTEFTADYPNVQIDANDLDGSTTPQRIFAWYCTEVATLSGIRNFFKAMYAEDALNYVFDVDVADITIENTNPSQLSVYGAWLRRSDGSSPLADTGYSIRSWYGKAAPVETGVSGLTTDESNKLDAAANAGNLTIVGGVVSADLISVKGHALTGSGAGPYV